MIRSLPLSLRSHVERIEATITHWPIRVTIDHAIKWVLQFEVDDYPLAVRIIENLDILSPTEIRTGLEIAHVKLNRKASEKGSPIKGNNTIYAGIGNMAKSGSLIAYHYRTVVELPEDDFFSGEEGEQLDLNKIDNIVLVDDVIGTGKTVASEVEQLAAEVYALSRTRNIFVLTVAGYEDGIQNVITATGASVISALVYNSRDTVSVLDGNFYEGLAVEERSILLDRIKHYCRLISKSELGFGNVGGLLVFDHNTPNTTIPIVWHNGKGWFPLFPRSPKIPGSAKVLKSIAEERHHQTVTVVEDPVPIKREEAELTLFVEGKLDEVFVDALRQHHELAKKIQVGEIVAIALGGLYQSTRLLELLSSAKKYAIFVIDDDEPSRRASGRMRILDSVPIVRLNPSFSAMLDITKIYDHRDRFNGLPDRISTRSDFPWLHDVETAVLKRVGITNNPERAIQIINEYLDPVQYDEFVTNLRIEVDKLFQTS